MILSKVVRPKDSWVKASPHNGPQAIYNQPPSYLSNWSLLPLSLSFLSQPQGSSFSSYTPRCACRLQIRAFVLAPLLPGTLPLSLPSFKSFSNHTFHLRPNLKKINSLLKMQHSPFSPSHHSSFPSPTSSFLFVYSIYHLLTCFTNIFFLTFTSA